MATFIKGDGAPRLIRSGTIVVDKYGLATATAVWWAYDKNTLLASNVTRIGFPHPVAPTLSCEKMQFNDSDGGTTLEASYAGILGTALPAPIDELDTVVMEAPIECHPDFATFAGTNRATAKNGAVWLPVPNSQFERFDGFGPDAPAGFRGVTSFEAPTSISRRTTVTTTAPQPNVVGTRRVPYETFGIHADWLLIGCSSQKRGNVYVTKYEWKAGGRLGWNHAIYS
jgi:hypothetical protein